MSSEHANDIQKRIYDFIVKYMRDEGMSPTNREIGSAMNIASTGHVDYHLSMLEKKGYVTRESKKSRGIVLAEDPFGIPVMGSIAAGEPLEVFSDSSEAIEVGRDIERQGTYALVVKGESMIEDHICDKDYIIIKPQATCENGDIIVAVHLQGEGRATLKRFFIDRVRNRIVLLSINSEVDPTYIPKVEWDLEWQVQGKAISILRRLRSSDPISLVLDALLPTTQSSQKIVERNVDNGEVSEASENLKRLIKQRSSNNTINNQVLANYAEDPVTWRGELKKELLESNVDKNPEIVKTAKTVVELKQKDEAFQRIFIATDTTRDKLDKISELKLNQAYRWYQYSLITAAIGFIIVIVGIALIFLTEKITIGVLTTVAGIIPEITAALVFQQVKEANKQLDNLSHDLIELEKYDKAFEYTLTTSDDIQDQYKSLIISRLLGLDVKVDKI